MKSLEDRVINTKREQGADFQLGRQISHGGSSIVYELDDKHVAKEKLSSFAQKIAIQYIEWDNTDIYQQINRVEQALQNEDTTHENICIQERVIKLQNNLDLCKKYLKNYFLESELIIKNNRNGIPSIYLIQERLKKEGYANMDPEYWNFKIDDESRKNLGILIMSIEKMYEDTGLMIDILTLNNIAYYPEKKQFYLFDADPLICSEEDMERLSETYEVSDSFLHEKESHLENKSTNCLEINLEHLTLLKSLLKTPDDYKIS